VSFPAVDVDGRRAGCGGRCGSGVVGVVCIIIGLGVIRLTLSFAFALTSTAATSSLAFVGASVSLSVSVECRPPAGLGVGREGGVLGHEILDKVFVSAFGNVCVC
jgi:hypothetical protein